MARISRALLAQSLSRSVAQSLSRSVAQSLSRSVAQLFRALLAGKLIEIGAIDDPVVAVGRQDHPATVVWSVIAHRHQHSQQPKRPSDTVTAVYRCSDVSQCA